MLIVTEAQAADALRQILLKDMHCFLYLTTRTLFHSCIRKFMIVIRLHSIRSRNEGTITIPVSYRMALHRISLTMIATQ